MQTKTKTVWPAGAWIITEDRINGVVNGERDDECYRVGVRSVDAPLGRPATWAGWTKFRLLDDDGSACYVGYIYRLDDCDGSRAFEPLDWASHDVGATEMHYRNDLGDWRQL